MYPPSSKTVDLLILESNNTHLAKNEVHIPDNKPYLVRFTVVQSCNSAFDAKAIYGWTWPVLGTTNPENQKSYYFVGRPGIRSLAACPSSIDYMHNNIPFSRRDRSKDTQPVYLDPIMSRNFYTPVCLSSDIRTNRHAPLVQLDAVLWNSFVSFDESAIPTLSELCDCLRYVVSGIDDDKTIYNATELLNRSDELLTIPETSILV